MKKLQLLFIALFLSAFAFSQTDSTLALEKIDYTNFKHELFEKLLLQKINDKRKQNQQDVLIKDSVLQAASEDQTGFMSKYGEVEILQSGKTKTTEKRIALHGGSAYGKELVINYKLKKGDKAKTYKEATDEIAFKWLKRKKDAAILENPMYIFAGVSATQGESDNKKVFISFVLGNYKSLKSGSDRIAELTVPYSKKKYGLKSYDSKICKKVDEYKRLSLLQQGLYLEDGIIYFQTDDYKRFKKLLKKSKNGIAVDVVQNEQYSCGGLNIVDNNTPWKGVMTKRLWSNKIIKKNMYKGKDAKTKLKVKLAKFPKGLDDNVEFNLILIQEKHICADIKPNYVEDAALENSNKLDFLADTISTDTNIDYIPKVEKTVLTFRIPFQRNKSTYEKSDIDPIIKSLNEPEFIIEKIQIEAFSSIEGDVKSNDRLQKKRGESIENALKSFIETNDNLSKAEVETDTNWDIFKQDVQGTEFSNIADMTLEEAQAYIKKNKLDKSLEPILSKHRYAEVQLNVTYDIKGNKEQAYVVSRFNRAVKASDRIKALSIQKYIFKKVLKGDYDKNAVLNQEIEESAANAGLLMNKYWLLKYVDELSVDGGMCEKVHALFQLDSSNPYLLFNDIYCEIQSTNLADEKRVNDIRQRMDDLYETNLSEKTVDGLNLKYLFGVIEAVDTVPETPELALYSLKKIKELVDIDEMNWKNALKLSYLFIEHHDYNYSAELLEPFLSEEYVFEEILFTYISLATHSETRIMSNRFVKAIEKAHKANPERLKTLFTSGRISPQVFDNQKVKNIICKAYKL